MQLELSGAWIRLKSPIDCTLNQKNRPLTRNKYLIRVITALMWNCQIHSRGDSKNLIALLIPNICLIFTDEIILICILKLKKWPNLISFMSLWKIQWTQSFSFSELYTNQSKSEIYPKMSVFEQLKKQVPLNSKMFLTIH